MTSGDAAQKQRVRYFWENTAYTLLWCCLFYIAVPVAIYLLSYMPYYLCDKHYGIMDVWNYQKFMWSYHSGLKATHPYSSTWWQWPFTIKPCGTI
jgi:predicted membrane-bound dolichyl-phosphate-mannose-protein mannosyltransferase